MKAIHVVRNAFWIIICKIIQSILALTVTMLTARYLGPSNYGLISYASSLVAFATPIMYLGFNSIVVQELINNPQNEGEVLGTAIGGCLVSATICIVGVVTFTCIVNAGERDTILVSFLYSFILLFQAIEIIQFWFQAKLKSKYTSVVMVSTYFIISVYRIWLLISNKSVYWFAVANALDAMLIGIVLVLIYKKLGGQKFIFSIRRGKCMWNRSKHFIVSSLMITIFTQTDKVMLKLMLDETVTGYYAAATTCVFLTNFVFNAIFDSMRPYILNSKANESNISYEKKMTTLFAIIIFLSVAQCVMIFLFSEWIIYILYGKEYAGAISILRVLVWYTLFSYIGMSRSIWILAESKQCYLWIINFSGAVANIILNLFMIPFWGGLGAAVASLITQFFTNVVMVQIIPELRKSNSILLKSLNPKVLINGIKFLRGNV